LTDATLIEGTLTRLDLRPDQKDAVRAFFAGPTDPARPRVVEMPTGTGKTRVGLAAAAVLSAAGRTVLWVCKRWKLLKQAAETATAFAPDLPLRRFGGRGELALPELTGGGPAGVVFTTLQTWYSRRDFLPHALGRYGRPAAVWDEVHWGFGSRVGRAFRHAYAGRVPVLGLSATPPATDAVTIVYRRAPEEYFGTVLAEPVFEQVETGVGWTPLMAADDFAPDSLRELAAHARRNAVVVDTAVRLRAEGRARCMIVFAADILHADDLARRLSERGVPARAVHSRQPPRVQDEAEAQFRTGAVDVLVNVDQLTEGFDHPLVDAVLLTRPTRSRRRWVQMVGRGARKAAGKDTFLVVDFADNLVRFGGEVVRAAAVFPTRVGTTARPAARPARHVEPPDAPRFENVGITATDTVPVAVGHTFGVEIELTSPAGVPHRGRKWERVAESLLRHLARHVAAPVHPEPLYNKGGPLTAWRVTYDGSAGWEVVSPILSDSGGFDDLRRACAAVSEFVAGSGGAVRVDHRTGLHLTLASRLTTDASRRGFVKLVQRLEPGLFTLVAPSRLYAYHPRTRRYGRRSGNRYCVPLRQAGDVDRLDLRRGLDRYRTVNLTKAAAPVPLVEVRMHHGTYEFRKIALWASLWMQLLNRARFHTRGEGRSGAVLPGRNRNISAATAAGEEVISLLRAESVALTPDFERLLRARRRELRPRWQAVLPRRVRVWAAAGWYD
jgi:superfamily II DNA or RNA helicase